MIRRHATALRFGLATADIVGALVVLVIASGIRFGVGAVDPAISAIDHPLAALAFYVIAWPVALWSQGLYRPRLRMTIRADVVDALRATGVFAAATVATLFLFKLTDVSRAMLATLFVLLAISVIASRAGVRWLLTWLHEHGRNTRYVLVLGTGAEAETFANLIDSQIALGLRVIGHLQGSRAEPRVSRPIFGTIEELETILHSNVVDEVAICLALDEWHRIDEIARLCEDEGRIVRIPVYLGEQLLSTARFEELEGVPVYSLVRGPDRIVGAAGKRLLDLLGAAIAGIVLAPVMLPVAVAIAIDSPGPVLFRQRRVGQHGRTFSLLKFRTMSRDAEDRLPDLIGHNEIQGHAFKLTDDPRVTRVGRFLRRTSLDELPQLWNVLRGEMSLVGPRPPLASEVAGYDIWHRRRLSVKPGMTGLWQVRSRHEPDFDRWVETDLEYIDRWSFWLDLKILAQTVPAVLGGQGR